MAKPVTLLEDLSPQDRTVALMFLAAVGEKNDRFQLAARATGLPIPLLRQLDAIDKGEEEDPDQRIINLVKTVNGIPSPPEELTDPLDKRLLFRPAPEMTAFMIATWVSKDGGLWHKEHQHLSYSHPAVLWTNVPSKRRGARVVGSASMPGNLKGDPWVVAQRKRQLLDWFGKIPEFMITLDAICWDEGDFRDRLATCEHEMLHCGQAKDKYGCPRFSMETGRPLFTLRGHDVEAFVLEGERYGAGATAGASVALFEAWKNGPTVTDRKIAEVCGTCRR